MAALRCEELNRPPVWLMRQAGRYLPEYRAMKETNTFVEMAHSPELAAEVTLQPLRRFPLDAAIIFSDILVVPEAMGQAYAFSDKGGIEMAFNVRDREGLRRLETDGAVQRLDYVGQALRRVRAEMGLDKALLGFCGSPWTLAAYMVEGGKPGALQQIREMFYRDRELFDALLEKVTGVCVEYVQMQAEAGADAVQIFDSWAGLCPLEIYEEASLKWIRKIIAAAAGRVPVILYAKGMGEHLGALAGTGAQVLSLDWLVSLRGARESLPSHLAVQGNLDPALLLGSVEITRSATLGLLDSMRGTRGHIFNLGHGLQPGTGVENVAALVEAVTGWRA